jgi:hypothetical protein
LLSKVLRAWRIFDRQPAKGRGQSARSSFEVASRIELSETDLGACKRGEGSFSMGFAFPARLAAALMGIMEVRVRGDHSGGASRFSQKWNSRSVETARLKFHSGHYRKFGLCALH